jgi:allophanate hydrolase
MLPTPLEIVTIHAAYRAGTLTPVTLVTELLARIDAYSDKAVFISRVPANEVIAAAAALDTAGLGVQPLWGIPYVVKDNIHVAGMETTAACPAFANTAAEDATAIARLRAAGAIMLGKTNLDQFATGLNGTRSPYGAPRSVFNADYISGGSSSGSAVAVAAGLCVFSLGTDTAGSGRVPAAFNNLIGLKPSIGRIPNTGCIPACKSLDCISIFSNSAADAMTVLAVAEGPEADSGAAPEFMPDPYSRPLATTWLPPQPRAGILRPEDRDFRGDSATEALYEAALKTAASLGWDLVEFDYRPFGTIAAALYDSPLVAERRTSLYPFLHYFDAHPEALDPSVRQIIEGAAKYSAVQLHLENWKIQALRRKAQAELAELDILLLPTAPTTYTVADMLADPLAKNANLGLYTNFVNILDLAAIALPAGFTPAGLPFGVTLVGPTFSEAALSALADALHRALSPGIGQSREIPATTCPHPSPAFTIVVAGAHLSGMVLNHELTNLGARLIATTKTAPDYKLFALATTPPKPGLVRAPGFSGPGIDVELWSLSPENFARFIAALPAPMGIGKVILSDGSIHPGFLCESHALETAADITQYGGWRAYRAAATQKS